MMTDTDPLKNIRVVLTRPSHPGNIGATARAMKTMGLSALHLVKPRHFPDPDADVRASGALDVLRQAVVHERLSAAVGDCVLAVATSSRHRELRHEGMEVREAARELAATAASHRVALVFGNETTGLRSDEASLCQVWAYIPANPRYQSLNLAAAVQVFAYELRMACLSRAPAATREFTPARLDEIERLYEHLEQTMVHAGFHDPTRPKRLLPRLRRLLARAGLEAPEVKILHGFLKAVDKLRR